MILKAISISSQSSGICLFFKVFSFSLIIGSKIVGEIRSNSSSKLDKYFKEKYPNMPENITNAGPKYND